jgi:hypothetical protein
MSGETCKGCRFHHPPPEGRKWDEGTCRRYPPTRTSGTGQAYRDGYPVPGQVTSWSGTSWPEVNDGNWCGEWQPKEGTT